MSSLSSLKGIHKTLKLMELHAKPIEYQFNDEELEFIKNNNNRNNYSVKYVIYKKRSEKPIGIYIDSQRNAPRRSPVLNSVDVIAERDITDLEYEEECMNFGTITRRFHCFWYNNINRLKQDDSKYGVTTPEAFVKECTDRLVAFP